MKVTIAPVKRVSITLFDKAQIIVEAYSAENTVRGTARKYKIQPKQIRQWKKKGLVEMFQGHRHRVTPLNATTDAVRANMMNDEDLEMDEAAEQTTTLLSRQQLMKKRKRLSKAYRLEGGGRKKKFTPHMERQLRRFFIELRGDDIPVDMDILVCQAKLLDPAEVVNVSDSALKQRVNRLLLDWGGSYRHCTHKAQDAKLSKRVMKNFHSYIKRKCILMDIPRDAVYNFDETNVHFSPNISHSWDVRGAKTVAVAESKSSQRCTAMVGSSMEGKPAIPFLIFKGANTRNGKIRQQLQQPVENGYPTGMEYTVQQNGWMDERVMLEWIEKVWKPISDHHTTTMLLLDSFTAHLTGAVMRSLAECNTEVEVIPAGYTSKLQPMDVGVNKPLKGQIRRCYSSWMVRNARRGSPRSKPTRISVAKWIKDGWEKITKQIFVNSFYGGGFDIAKYVDGDNNNNDNEDNEVNNVDVLALN